MLNDFSCSCPVYIACGYTDLRRGIDGLATLVKSQFQMDPFQRALFLFCGRRRDRIKALYWEGDGFLLLYKRLESGGLAHPQSGSRRVRVPAQPEGGARGGLPQGLLRLAARRRLPGLPQAAREYPGGGLLGSRQEKI